MTSEGTEQVADAVALVFREQWGQIVATVIRITGDWDLAEECAQDAFAKALERWPADGIPLRPGAWLTTTARNRAIDRRRRDQRGADKLLEIAASEPTATVHIVEEAEPEAIVDDRLRLIFTCCHPALALETRIALTLRTLAGMSTAEIARAFLVSEMTMSKRLVRAKNKIRNAGIPFRVPPAHLLAERTDAVLGVLYLLFNEGYLASSGASLVRNELCLEAIRLSRLLVDLMPDQVEAGGLLALMLFHEARHGARVDARGDIVTLESQDRSRWNRHAITEGLTVLGTALRKGRVGPYQLQAAIMACHVSATTWAATDWGEIVSLYDVLLEHQPTAVVRLNRAIAVAMWAGPEAGLVLLDELDDDGELEAYHLLPAARAELLRRLDRFQEAAMCYRAALACEQSESERRYLGCRLSEVSRVA